MKMKRKKKQLSLFMAFVMLIGLLPITAFAENSVAADVFSSLHVSFRRVFSLFLPVTNLLNFVLCR